MNETTYVFKAYPLKKGGYFIAIVKDDEKSLINSEKDITRGKEARLSNAGVVAGIGSDADVVDLGNSKRNDTAKGGDRNA